MLILACLPLAFLAPQSSAEVPIPVCHDVDDDGRVDLYCMAGEVPGRGDVLLRNQGDGQYEDVTAASGLFGNTSRAALFHDLDGDGLVELVTVTVSGSLRVHAGARTGRELSFVDRTVASGVEELHGVLQVGLVGNDLWVTTVGSGQVLLRHRGQLVFESITLAAGERALPREHVVVLPAAEPVEPSPTDEDVLEEVATAGRWPVAFSTAAPVRGSGASTPTPTPPGSLNVLTVPFRAHELLDQAAPANGIGASSVPTLGALYPLSQDFFVDANGRVGIGTTTPSSDVVLHVEGKALIGKNNRSAGVEAAVGGGQFNFADAVYSTVAGGIFNLASGPEACIGGGASNIASGTSATIPGGRRNLAQGDHSFAAGRTAQAVHDSTFVWNTEALPFTSTAPEQFLIQADGGVGVGTNEPFASLHVELQDLAIPTSAIFEDDLIAEDNDAILGLYSNDTGANGSGIVLGAIASGALVDKWSIVRESSAFGPGGSGLAFAHGSSADYNVNPVHFYLSASGQVGIGTETPQSDLHLASLGGLELLLEADTNNSGEDQQAAIVLSQDGGLVVSRLGFFESENGLTLESDYDADMRFDLPFAALNDWEFRNQDNGGNRDIEARITAGGDLQLDGSVSSPAADLAEYYAIRGALEPGDVVAFVGDGLTLERATTLNAARLAGVVSSKPGLVLGLSGTDEAFEGVAAPQLADDERFLGDERELQIDRLVLHEIEHNARAPLALAGRVPCKASAVNGAIRPGDLLTVSPVDGHAMRATEAGPVLGTALEALDAGRGRIVVLVHLGWFTPREALDALRNEVDELRAEFRGELAALRAQLAHPTVAVLQR